MSGTNFVRVRNGQCQLMRTGTSGVLHTFSRNVDNAIVEGNEVVVNLKNGNTEIWEITSSGRSVYGPLHVYS